MLGIGDGLFFCSFFMRNLGDTYQGFGKDPGATFIPVTFNVPKKAYIPFVTFRPQRFFE